MRRRAPQRPARRGVALLLVLGLIVIVGGATAAMASSARRTTDAAAALRARATARAMAESGIDAAVVRLAALMASGDSTLLNAVVLDNAAGGALVRDSLVDGAFITAVRDPGAQLDLNRSDLTAVAALVRTVLPAPLAAPLVSEIAQRRAPLPGQRIERAPFADVADLRALPGMTAAAFAQLAPLVTVDGDGVINRVTAPPAVLTVASGSVVTQPTRLVLIARGWRVGHPLTHEITAVVDVTGATPRLITWRERDL